MTNAKKAGLAVLVLGGIGTFLLMSKPASAETLPDERGSGKGVTDYTPVPGTSSSSDPSRGDATVQTYQQRLSALGYDPGPIDGRYGSLTRRAVTDFQRDNGLGVDGILGPRTKAAIDAAFGQPASTAGWGLSSRPTKVWKV